MVIKDLLNKIKENSSRGLDTAPADDSGKANSDSSVTATPKEEAKVDSNNSPDSSTPAADAKPAEEADVKKDDMPDPVPDPSAEDAKPVDVSVEESPKSNNSGNNNLKSAQGESANKNADANVVVDPSASTINDEPFGTRTISKESASMLNLLMEQIKTLVEVSNNLNERTKEVEKRINEITVDLEKQKENSKIMNEKMDSMEKNMEKFIGLYEVVTNQYNPFLEGNDDEAAQAAPVAAPSPAPASAAPDPYSSPMPAPQPAPAQPAAAPPVAAPVAQAGLGGAGMNQIQAPVSQPYSQQPMQQNNMGNMNQQPNYNQQMQNLQNSANAPLSNSDIEQYRNPPQAYNQPSFNFEDKITGERDILTPQGSQPTIQGGYGNRNSPLQFQDGMNNSMQQHGMNQGQYQNNNNNNNPYFNQMNNQQMSNPNNQNFNPNMQSNYPQQPMQGMMQANMNPIQQPMRQQNNGFANFNQIQQRPSNVLRLANGKDAQDIEGMLDELIYLDDNLFSSHVNPYKNDFADWIQGSLGQLDLANKIRPLQNKSDIIRELAMFLHGGN